MMLETSMETSFYPEESCTQSYVKMRNLKRMMTLDLDSPGKRGKFNGGGSNAGLLSSPDLNMLKLGSPELESLLIQQHGHVTTTPTPSAVTGHYPAGAYPKTVTEEQELYARGFTEALAELHSSVDQYQQASSPANSSSSNDVDLNGYHLMQYGNQPASTSNYSDYLLPAHMNIKEEPQTVPNGARDTPPLSPIDMMAQERIKLERKRQRNRLAASKCRRRKLERIARLEDKVRLLKDDNTELGVVVAKLKEHICQLKEQLMQHVNNGCQLMTSTDYNS